MASTQDATNENIGKEATTESEPRTVKIDRTAPAGSENSLGAQSVRDGRPTTDDGTIEAMDEVGPEISPPLTRD
jgi:hypothetical protein